jgi:hypothetical protein
MRRARWAAIALTVVLTACVRTSEGVPVAGDAAETGSPGQSSTATPTDQPDIAEPGVVPTNRTPVPPDPASCPLPNPPPVSVVASVSDPAAPKITIALPAGWGASGGDGDVGVRLVGPDGISARVTIVATSLDAADAFRKYTDEVMAASTVSSVSVVPAELCGYSGQKLLGAWSDSRQQAVEFGDRLAHIWTNTDSYLVAVHVEGPASTAEFEPNASPLMEDFAIDIP